MSAFPDVPVACVKSGVVLVLEAVLPEHDYELAVEKLHRVGAKTRFVGRVCPACSFQKSVDVAAGREKGSTCEYRPLQGPLFVPR